MNEASWEGFMNMSDGEITFKLYSEGKSVDLIAKIRNLDKGIVQKHLIDYKIKNRYTARIKSPKDLFKIFANANKNDKLKVLQELNHESKDALLNYINTAYTKLNYTDKTTAAWVIGELKAVECATVLKKASVHTATTVRRMAVSAMGKIGDPSLASALMRALEDKNDQVAMYAVNSLRRMRCLEAKGKLISMRGKRKEYVDRAIDSYLEEIEGKEE